MGTHKPYLFQDETPCSESLNITIFLRERERKKTRVVVPCRTSNEDEVSDGREHGRLVTAHFTRVVAAVFSRHICHHTAV